MWFLRTLFMLSQLLLVQLMRDVVPQNIVHAFTVVVGPVDERCGSLEHCSSFTVVVGPVAERCGSSEHCSCFHSCCWSS